MSGMEANAVRGLPGAVVCGEGGAGGLLGGGDSPGDSFPLEAWSWKEATLPPTPPVGRTSCDLGAVKGSMYLFAFLYRGKEGSLDDPTPS